MGEIITMQSEIVTKFISATTRMREAIARLSKSYKPTFGGDRFITDAELTQRLKISDRTTQDWRSKGKIDYLQFEVNGKVLYRESDIQKFLEKHYQKAWRDVL
ncbi:MAG: helix-turn-helix domain-containing protein [Rikenellaceae bacterium]